jgi:putative chitinase
MLSITETDLRCVLQYCRYPEEWVRPLNDAMQKFGIAENEKRIAAFLGQIGVESSHLNHMQENMSYSPQRIFEVWSKRFESLEEALPYGRNPEKLANRVYADRMGNGPEQSGDGFRYRGRGLLQITGRANYKRVSELLDLPGLIEMPDHLCEPRIAALSAAAWWEDKNCNQLADAIDEDNLDEPVKKLTKRVNGGLRELEKRTKITELALDILTEDYDI